MNPHTRACAAYVAGIALLRINRVSLYDYTLGSHRSIEGTVSGRRVDVYDYDRGCHFDGFLPDLYDYGIRNYVSLDLRGQKFEGYDYDTSSYFEVTMRGRGVTVYDYSLGQYFEYSV